MCPSKPGLHPDNITVLEYIIICLIIRHNNFTFYSYNGFLHTSMVKHTSMLKTIIWVQGKIMHVIHDFTLNSCSSFQHTCMFCHTCMLKAIMLRCTHNECIWIYSLEQKVWLWITLLKKMKFSITDFFGKYDQIRRIADLVTFTEEILNGKLHFLCSVK